MGIAAEPAPPTPEEPPGEPQRRSRPQPRSAATKRAPAAAATPPPQAGEAAPAAAATPPPQASEAAPAPEVAPAPAPAVVPAEIGFGHIRDAWPATLQEVNKRSKRVWGLLSPSAPLRFGDGVLVVEVQSDFHEKALQDEPNRALVAEALHSALGIRPVLQFEKKGAPAPEKETLDDVHEAQTAGPTDPVEWFKKDLGAEVVEEREEGPR